MATKKKVISRNAKGKKGSKIVVPKKKAIMKKAIKATVKHSNIAKKKKVLKKITSKKQTKKTVEKKVPVKKIAKKITKKADKKKSASIKKTKMVVKKPSEKKAQVKKIKKEKMPTKKTISIGTLFVGNIAPYQPKKTEPYMSKGMLKHFRLLLETWKQELMEKADSTMNQLKDEAVNYADPNDRASQEEGFSLELRARDRERKLIRKIEETLDLIDSDEYGFCKECGEEIGLRRLEARPTAALCVDCKTLDEIKEKQTGV